MSNSLMIAIIGASSGLIGVIAGSIISGYYNFRIQRESVKAIQENLSKELEATKENLDKELVQRKNVEQFKIMCDSYKYAIDAAIDIMKATWILKADANINSFNIYLDAWNRTWKASAQLHMFLDLSTVNKYDKIVEEIQQINFQELIIDQTDPNSSEKYRSKMNEFRKKVEEVLKPLKDMI